MLGFYVAWKVFRRVRSLLLLGVIVFVLLTWGVFPRRGSIGSVGSVKSIKHKLNGEVELSWTCLDPEQHQSPAA